MKYVNFDVTGLRVSRLCFGGISFGASTRRDWLLDEKAARPIFKRAFEAGINFYDSAEVLTTAEMRALEAPHRPHPVLGIAF